MMPAAPESYTNPILSGSYPDPSICRVDDDYYLVNSSFEYFPGLPIHHSRDLVNWELVGYGLHRVEQCSGRMNLVDVQTRGGIHAPTIRHHDGRFYIITTNVYVPAGEGQDVQFINFIITAENIAGPWSEPHILEGAPGIDPDIFFDDDGKVWYLGTHSPEKPNFAGEGEIWLQEIDLSQWVLTGERHFLWRGACGGVWVEGPHLYKRAGRYYLLVAEGGTSFNHAVMVAVSDEISGPYTANARNPIFTTRHLSYDYWVNSVGHADMVELPDGRWYMVALGIRNEVERGSNMGRETYLVPLLWEREPFEWKAVKDEWPVVVPETGRIERHTPLPFADRPQAAARAYFDDFSAPELNLAWNFRRVPLPGCYSLNERPGYLRLYARPEVIQERGRSSLLGIRQKESATQFEVAMHFLTTQERVQAGVVVLQQDDNFLDWSVIYVSGQYHLQLRFAEPGSGPKIVDSFVLTDYTGNIFFRLSTTTDGYKFEYRLRLTDEFQQFARTPANLVLSRGYTGAYFSLYSTSNGAATKAWADFEWVSRDPSEIF